MLDPYAPQPACPCGADGPHCDLKLHRFVQCKCGMEWLTRSLREVAQRLEIQPVYERTYNHKSAAES